MRKKYDIIIISALLILIMFIASFIIESGIIVLTVIILITLNLIFNLTNLNKIKEQLKNGAIYSIPIDKPKSAFNIFWWIMLILWIILTIVSIVSGYNILLGLLNIWICLNWLFFRNSRFSIFYNTDGIWFTRFKAIYFSFDEILDFKIDTNRIIITSTNGREIKFPKYEKEVTNDLFKIIENYAARDIKNCRK